MRILVIEDVAELAEVLTVGLELEGHTVLSTPSGLQGILMLERGGFDLALVDLQVHDLSGLGVQKAVSDFRRLPLIVMSASLGGWRSEALRAGAMAVLPKPFEMDALSDLIATAADGLGKVPANGMPGDVRRLSEGDLQRVRSMPREQIDALPFGAIVLDRQRRIVSFNSYESRASGLSESELIGRPFAELAPCSLVREFVEAIDRGFEEQRLDTVLRFVFPHHTAWAVVNVRFFFDDLSHRMWLFVSKRKGEASEAVVQWSEPLREIEPAV